MSLQQPFEQRFKALVEEHFARAVRFCARMLGDIGEGEEVAQQAFVRLYEKRRDLSDTEGSLPYLYRVLRNACVDHLRARKPARDLTGEELARSEDLSRAERDEVARALFDALEWLEPGQKEAVLLRYYEGLALPDVAKVLGQTVGATAMKLTRAKQKLREKLGKLPEFSDLAGDET